MLANLKIAKKRTHFLFTIVVLGFLSHACDNGGSKRESPSAPAPAAGSCSGSKKNSLALQSSSSGLQVSYEKATENGKDISSTGSIKALLAKNCVTCHKSSGSNASDPSLATFKEAKEYGSEIHSAVKSGSMPPKKADVAKSIVKYFDAWKQAGYPETLSSKATGSTSGGSSRSDSDSDDDDSSSGSSGKGSSSSNSNKSSQGKSGSC